MNTNAFWHFLTLQLFKERSQHLFVIFISVMILFLLSSVLFISSSIRFSLQANLQVQPDFVVSRMQGEQRKPTPIVWTDELLDIFGIQSVTPRVYGRYFVTPKGKSFLIVGVDFMEEQSHKDLRNLIDKTDIRAFFKTKQMLVGSGVKAYLKAHFYEDEYHFLSPKGISQRISIYKTLPTQSNLISNDMIIMPIDLAREILGYSEEEVTDISFNVPNPDEWDRMSDKLSALHYDLHVVNKKKYKSLMKTSITTKEVSF